MNITNQYVKKSDDVTYKNYYNPQQWQKNANTNKIFKYFVFGSTNNIKVKIKIKKDLEMEDNNRLNL